MSDCIHDLIAAGKTGLADTSDTAELDTEVLLCHCLNKTRSFLRAWPEHQPTPAQIAQFKNLIDQRRSGRPIAYLTGEREFWSRNFSVSPDVLIPRPDTELLIELSLALIPSDKPCKIIDLGTGSGIIGITLAAERAQAQVLATDLSVTALAVAKRNAKHHRIDNINFLQSSWFTAVTENDFDLVISNPPYIADNDVHLQQGDVRFEPISALVSPENGLQDIRLLAEQGRSHLKPGGQLLVEHGYDQQTPVQDIFKDSGYLHVNTHYDLSGNPRVTSGIWKPL